MLVHPVAPEAWLAAVTTQHEKGDAGGAGDALQTIKCHTCKQTLSVQ